MAAKTIQPVLVESEGRYCVVVPFPDTAPLFLTLDARDWDEAVRKFDIMLVQIQNELNAISAIDQAFTGIDTA